jgi:hypothetical protein
MTEKNFDEVPHCPIHGDTTMISLTLWDERQENPRLLCSECLLEIIEERQRTDPRVMGMPLEDTPAAVQRLVHRFMAGPDRGEA